MAHKKLKDMTFKELAGHTTSLYNLYLLDPHSDSGDEIYRKFSRAKRLLKDLREGISIQDENQWWHSPVWMVILFKYMKY